MKIYVASSWRNPFQPGIVEALRAAGHEVYDFRNPSVDDVGFQWSAIDENWENWTTEEYIKALESPVAQKGFDLDFDAMKWADACVMVLPCGRSANTEAGWMKGKGKQVFVLQLDKQEPELMYKIYDGIAGSFGDLLNIMAQKAPNPYACFGRRPHIMDFETRDEYELRRDGFDAFEIARGKLKYHSQTPG